MTTTNRHLVIGGCKKAKGYKGYKMMWEGKKLTRMEAMDAFCFECNGGYADWEDPEYKMDCECYGCPMYEHNYYRNGGYLSKRKNGPTSLEKRSQT